MWRGVISFAVALTFFSSIALAQQPCTTDARHVVDEVYRHMLERSADSGSTHWVNELQAGRMTVRDVVRAVAKSPEYKQRFVMTEVGEETPNIRSVNRLYRHLLGRQPDAEGARYWAGVLNQQGVDFVIDQITSSQEYNQQLGDWGVPGSGGVKFCAPNNATASTQSSTSTVAQNQNDMDTRFRAMDRNNDGVVTQDEWRGSRSGFRARDTNHDGVLSGDEVRAVGTSGSFESLDRGELGTSGDLIYVDAMQRWTDTGIDVQQGDLVRFDAEGTMQL